MVGGGPHKESNVMCVMLDLHKMVKYTEFRQVNIQLRKKNEDGFDISKRSGSTRSNNIFSCNFPDVMRQELVKFYQHIIKFSHASPGFHDFFWVFTSFSR